MNINQTPAARREKIATRLITLVLGVYTIALFAQTVVVFNVA